jgi:hypothetical protein
MVGRSAGNPGRRGVRPPGPAGPRGFSASGVALRVHSLSRLLWRISMSAPSGQDATTGWTRSGRIVHGLDVRMRRRSCPRTRRRRRLSRTWQAGELFGNLRVAQNIEVAVDPGRSRRGPARHARQAPRVTAPIGDRGAADRGSGGHRGHRDAQPLCQASRSSWVWPGRSPLAARCCCWTSQAARSDFL